MKVAVVLGAGYSSVGGVPLTKNLFEAPGGLPRAQGQSVPTDHAKVLASYSRWKVAHPSETAEQCG